MRVITFSRYFPKGHPKEGQETFFVEKMWMSLIDQGLISMSKAVELSRQTGIGNLDMYNIRKVEHTLKFHTIRAGNRWKVGDEYSPRVWSGKPYASKQIEFAPPIRIEKTWNVKIKIKNGVFKFWINGELKPATLVTVLAKNDGLAWTDFLNWFNCHPKNKLETFTGQILCHNPEINY